MKTQKFTVEGMTCTACVAHVEKSVNKLGAKAEVSLLTNSMTVQYDENTLNERDIIAAVKKGGYSASIMGGAPVASDAETILIENASRMKTRFFTSLVLLILLMYVSMGHMVGLPLPMAFHGAHGAATFALTQFLLTLPILYLNRNYFIDGFASLAHGAPNMDALVAIGSGAALVYGVYALYKIGIALGVGDMAVAEHFRESLYFESAAMILTLVTLGKYLETRSRGKTGEAIRKLMDLTPKTAVRVEGGEEREVPVSEVRVGDLLAVRPGSSVPADGVVREGVSSVDESALSGESIPVEKTPGALVRAGTVNKSGYFRFEVTQTGEDTTVSRMARLVEEAAAGKAPIARLADKVSGIFVPIVIVIAFLSAVFWLIYGQGIEFALSTAIAVLVISCPCALGLATPVAIMVGTGVGALRGMLIKSAEALESAHKLDVVVMDKTGTLTEGKPVVTDVIAKSLDEASLLRVAAALEAPSEHPLAEAILAYAKAQGVEVPSVQGFEAVPGKGVRAELNGAEALAGNAAFLHEHGVEAMDAEALAKEGKTPLHFALGGKYAGCIAVADTEKPTSRDAVEGFRKLNVQPVMLTGDNAVTAKAVARRLGIEKVYAGVLPEEKANVIAELKRTGKVAMIGDGINDAPALALADVGIAIGAGTDIAIESADIVLMRNDLMDAVSVIELSKAVVRNIKGNLFWAFFYNVVGIPLAAGVFFLSFGLRLNPMFGAAAMSLSSFFVVTNALRLKLFKPKAAEHIKARRTSSERITVQEPKIIQEATSMTKEIIIDGMTCEHCSSRVEKALNAISGVSAKVDLASKTATLTLCKDVPDAVLTAAVEDAGYEVEVIR